MKLKTIQLILSPILIPIAFLYGIVIKLRNYLFDVRILKSVQFEPFVICVGNLRAGGTGKTPFVNFLISQFIEEHQLAVLSRGYKRSTKGFLIADAKTHPTEIGDEPMMYHQTYGSNICVAVGEDRVMAIPNIMYNYPDTDIIILDDAYQHRSVQPDFNILITDFNHLFTKDYLLPYGFLRELREGAKRADVVLVSKCPSTIPEAKRKEIALEILKYTTAQLFFTEIKQCQEVGTPIKHRPVIVFSAIAQNEQFAAQLAQKYQVVDTLFYSDHHWYTTQDIDCLRTMYEMHQAENPVIVTTEKDFVRLQARELKDALEGLPLCFVPIKVRFVEGESTFLATLKSKIGEK